jgi:hypothetical protein
VIELWPDIARFIEASVTTGRYRSADYLRMCILGQAQLWIVYEGQPIGAAITAVQSYPGGRWGRYLILGAENFMKMAAHEDVIDGYHRALGCKGMEMCGRKGWERLLRGWKMTHVEMHKEFEGGSYA